jgi:hypothetical protein
MTGQIRFFPHEPKPVNKAKRNWENAFQKWSNKMAQNETDPLGICGFDTDVDYFSYDEHRKLFWLTKRCYLDSVKKRR